MTELRTRTAPSADGRLDSSEFSRPSTQLRTTLAEWAPPPLRSSHLAARCDLYLRLQGEPATGQLAGLTFTSLGCNWRRNRPGVADELEVKLLGTDLPFDLRIIKGAAIDHWLFEDRNPGARQRGERGHFAGIVDSIRRDRYANTISLKCRDMTALALSTKVGEGVLAAMSLDGAPNLETMVRALLDLMPDGDTWAIESIAATEGLTVGPALAPKIEIRGKGGRGSAAQRKARAAHNAKAPNLGMLLPQGDTTVWAAITELCIRLGVVPEVQAGANGHPKVVLVNASDLQTSAVLRPFERNGRKWRELVDGRDCTAFEESLELTSSTGKPDFVDVASTDPRTGATVSARWPPGAGKEKGKPNNGILQTIDGVTNQLHLVELARSAFNALAHNQFSLQVGVPHPWSAGGGPDDPDLLDLGYGAAVAMRLPGLERHRLPAAEVLQRRGIDSPAIAARLARASERMGDLALLFQVVEVEHDWGGGNAPAYKCGITMRQFLGTDDLPILGDLPLEPRSLVA